MWTTKYKRQDKSITEYLRCVAYSLFLNRSLQTLITVKLKSDSII